MPEITLLESIRQGLDEMMASDARGFGLSERRGGLLGSFCSTSNSARSHGRGEWDLGVHMG